MPRPSAMAPIFRATVAPCQTRLIHAAAAFVELWSTRAACHAGLMDRSIAFVTSSVVLWTTELACRGDVIDTLVAFVELRSTGPLCRFLFVE